MRRVSSPSADTASRADALASLPDSFASSLASSHFWPAQQTSRHVAGVWVTPALMLFSSCQVNYDVVARTADMVEMQTWQCTDRQAELLEQHTSSTQSAMAC